MKKYLSFLAVFAALIVWASCSLVTERIVPTIAISSPANNSTFETNVTIEGTTTISTGAVQMVQVRVNGGSWQTATGTDSWSLAIVLTRATNVIQAMATSDAGVESTVASITVYSSTIVDPDTTAPTLNITAPNNGDTVGAVPFGVNGTAFDNYTNALEGVYISVDSGSYSLVPNTSVDASTNISWGTNLTVALGSHTIAAYARDAAGNNSAIRVVNVTYEYDDCYAPTFGITQPSAGVVWTNFNMEGVVTNDSDTAITGVYYRLNSGGYSMVTGSSVDANPGVVWGANLGVSEGFYTLEAYALDADGNTSPTNGVTFTATNFINEVEPNNGSSTANEIYLSVPTFAEINVSDDLDWFNIDVEVGQTYEITTSTNGADGVDTYLVTYEADGSTVISQDDDSGPIAGYSQLSVDGFGDTLYIQVSSVGSGGSLTGAYQMRMVKD